LTQFVRHCAEHYLSSEYTEVRTEAVKTCAKLLSPLLNVSLYVIYSTDEIERDIFESADGQSGCSSVSEMWCLKLLPQYLSDLNKTCYI